MKTLTIRLTADEHDRLKNDARLMRMGMAPYLLSLWEGGGRKQPKPSSVSAQSPISHVVEPPKPVRPTPENYELDLGGVDDDISKINFDE